MIPALSIIALLLFTMGAFIWGGRRYEVIAICSLSAATLMGFVPFSQVFSGFSQPAVITVIAVMILSKAISQTGIIDMLAKAIIGRSSCFFVHLSLLSALTMFLSAFMNNVGAMAIILPVAMDLCDKTKKPPSIVLMPIALSAALGGLTTLIGTPPNIIISQFREKTLGEGFGFFSFSQVGLPLALIGLLFLILVGWRLLPKDRKGSHSALALAVEDYITEICLGSDTDQPVRTVGELESNLTDEVQLIGLIRNNRRRGSLRSSDLLQANDILVLEGSPEAIKEVMQLTKATLVGSDEQSGKQLQGGEFTILEGIVSQRSLLEGATSKSMKLRKQFQMMILAISRQGKTIRTRIAKTKLKAGDVLLLQGPTATLKSNAAQLGLLPLQGRDLTPLPMRQSLMPVLLFFLAILTTALGYAPVQIAFFGAIALMVLFKMIPARMLYEGVDWPIIILLGCMIPIGVALQTTGASGLITSSVLELTQYLPTWSLIPILLFVTMTLSDFMNNAATAIIMAPIAVSIAASLGVSPDGFLMSVSIGASCAFITPIGHQNNLLILGPGGYRFSDYLRAGIPLEVIILALGTPLILWAWPL